LGERDLLKAWVKAVAQAENGFSILMGDTCDFARTHYRDHIRGYTQDSNSQEAIDNFCRRDVEALAKELMPIKKKLMGAILGNHSWCFMDGTNSEQYLCRLLGIPYLDSTGFIRLEFRDRLGICRHVMTVWAHHSGGTSGGRTSGGDVNSLERAEHAFDADIYLLSHTHRRYGTKQTLLKMTTKGEPRLQERTKVFIRTGAFLKGYKEDMPTSDRHYSTSYAEQKALRPTDLGWVTVHIRLIDAGLKPKHLESGVKQDIRIEF
jgi:hypothetical protein